MTARTKNNFANCRNKKNTIFKRKDGQLVEYSKCIRDGKSCREYDMLGYDCYDSI